jgi:hypothetical protein
MPFLAHKPTPQAKPIREETAVCAGGHSASASHQPVSSLHGNLSTILNEREVAEIVSRAVDETDPVFPVAEGLSAEALLKIAADLGIEPERMKEVIDTFLREEADSRKVLQMASDLRAEVGLGDGRSQSLIELIREVTIRKQAQDIKNSIITMLQKTELGQKVSSRHHFHTARWELYFSEGEIEFSGFGEFDPKVAKATAVQIVSWISVGAVAFAIGGKDLAGIVAVWSVLNRLNPSKWGLPTLWGPDLTRETSSPALNELLQFCHEAGIRVSWPRRNRFFEKEEKSSSRMLVFHV